MGRKRLLLELRRFSAASSSHFCFRPDAFQNSKSLLYSIRGGYHKRVGGKFYFPAVPNCFHQAGSFSSLRSFSWTTPTEHAGGDSDNLSEDSTTELESPSLGFGGLELVDEATSDMKWYSPVRAVIMVLDGYHDLSGFPWWVIIVSSTLALRLSLLPVLILQLKKLEKLSALIPKLPPPFPPLFSGRSYRKQFLFFQNQRRAIGCPSPLWSFASFLVQVPCFILWMVSIRRMSLDHHPGFDTGGTLWFQNLTEFPHGILAPVFPLLIASLHYINVQISFGTSTIRSSPGMIGLLAKYYKIYLDILTIPILFIGFYVPQGSLVYWVTNSSLNAVQQLSLRNPYIRQMLGLRATNPPASENVVEVNPSNKKPLHPLSLRHPYILQKLGLQASSVAIGHGTCTEDLPPDNLYSIALQHLAAGNQENAFPLLRLASQKDPELEDRTSLAMGLFLLSKESHVEAAECFEQAISKIKRDDITNLVIAYYGAGFSHILQGRKYEGIEHLKRIAELKEPENPMDKFCYFQGLVILGSTLFNEGQKAEALKYLHIAAAFDPNVNKYIEECERAEHNSYRQAKSTGVRACIMFSINGDQKKTLMKRTKKNLRHLALMFHLRRIDQSLDQRSEVQLVDNQIYMGKQGSQIQKSGIRHSNTKNALVVSLIAREHLAAICFSLNNFSYSALIAYSTLQTILMQQHIHDPEAAAPYKSSLKLWEERRNKNNKSKTEKTSYLQRGNQAFRHSSMPNRKNH
ncbi:hypothetical protein H6P81_013446 [Aristolochia fimbriata]|uniref:ALBINO3-like protein 2, chloroplastic n=1 Tax=Aristolochia fimbriata TaxID=158543 RepID=A0AAV7EJD5_ARIFI|nr:hypothetical protein H6P81_013446 [Aristolochia fimbriata]